jgi:predicted ribosome quality control (RQC) complex YloA/Tae2 family protein
MSIYADLKRGSSTLFICDDFARSKRFQAPFDVALSKRFNSSVIESVEASPNDRVLIIKCAQKGSYKLTRATLQLEFTGKNTNAIILDEDGVIIDALRHIDADTSYRVVKVGEKLAPLPPYKIRSDEPSVGDVEAWLRAQYTASQGDALRSLKASKLSSLRKKIERLDELLNGLESESELEMRAKDAHDEATLLLSNRHLLQGARGECEITDAHGVTHRLIISPFGVQANIDELFAASKRLRSRAAGVHVERQNLSSKLEFSRQLLRAVEHAATREEVEILLPRRQGGAKKDEPQSAYQTFYFEGYKIMVGRSERGNVELLKLAKKNDIWFHLQAIPSAHVILKTDRSNLGEAVIAFCAKLCATFSPAGSGAYDVDYTPRRNVKMGDGAHVNYVEYKTTRVFKE